MNPEVTRILSSITVPSKQMMLSVLRSSGGELTIPEICEKISMMTNGEVSYFPASYRHQADESLLKSNIVSKRTRGTSKRPFYWKLNSTFYGDLANRALSFTSDVSHSIEFFTGHLNNKNNPRSGASAHMLYLAREGVLCNVNLEYFGSMDFVSLWSYYDCLEKKLLFKDGKDLVPSDLAIRFVEQIYDPIVAFSASHPRNTLKGIKSVDGKIYSHSERLHQEYTKFHKRIY